VHAACPPRPAGTWRSVVLRRRGVPRQTQARLEKGGGGGGFAASAAAAGTSSGRANRRQRRRRPWRRGTAARGVRRAACGSGTRPWRSGWRALPGWRWRRSLAAGRWPTRCVYLFLCPSKYIPMYLPVYSSTCHFIVPSICLSMCLHISIQSCSHCHRLSSPAASFRMRGLRADKPYPQAHPCHIYKPIYVPFYMPFYMPV
jgi:hypothetical protein